MHAYSSSIVQRIALHHLDQVKSENNICKWIMQNISKTNNRPTI